MSDLAPLAEGLAVLRAQRGPGAVLAPYAGDVIRLQLRGHGWHFRRAGSLDVDVVAFRVRWARCLAHARPLPHPPSQPGDPS